MSADERILELEHKLGRANATIRRVMQKQEQGFKHLKRNEEKEREALYGLGGTPGKARNWNNSFKHDAYQSLTNVATEVLAYTKGWPENWYEPDQRCAHCRHQCEVGCYCYERRP